MVAAFLLLLAASPPLDGFAVANTPGSTSDFPNRILSIEQRTGTRIGVAALDTGSGKRLDYRSEERFPMCSTFKFLAAAAVLKRVDDGQEKLDRFIPYGAKDILEYAPVTKAHLNDGGMTLAALCAAAIEQSDNTAGNLHSVSSRIGCGTTRPEHSWFAPAFQRPGPSGTKRDDAETERQTMLPSFVHPDAHRS
jgi:beta-lactamase class A